MALAGLIIASLGLLIGLWGLFIDLSSRGEAPSSILPYFIGWILSSAAAICLAIALLRLIFYN